ncbi:MAG: lipid-A-disaccharide synthase [Endomicrobium sp.]|jgi:lipid-A-disaccharide synthase|nr:lipid-A-disaccharide synthase [Endomicrobium sp.]
MMIQKFFISAGDLSGDIHASNLVKEIKNLLPSFSSYIFAVGGKNLKMVADFFVEDIVNIGAFGFLPIKQIFFLRKVFQKITLLLKKNHPDKIILVDYYGFHVHIAKLAKKLKIPVYYYISPQIWASRYKRIKEIAKTVKKIFVIFHFEEKLYTDNGVEAMFVGNPLIDIINVNKKIEKRKFDILNPPVIGLFPGSRQSIIKKHIPIIVKTAKILRQKINAKFIIFFFKNNTEYKFPKYIDLSTSQDYKKRASIDFAICPSGTVNLENALIGIPMSVIYKLSYINFFIIKTFIKIKYISIVNILLDKAVIPELIQFDATPKKIASSVLEQLNPKNYMLQMRMFIKIKKMLGTYGVSKRVAKIIIHDK